MTKEEQKIPENYERLRKTVDMISGVGETAAKTSLPILDLFTRLKPLLDITQGPTTFTPDSEISN